MACKEEAKQSVETPLPQTEQRGETNCQQRREKEKKRQRGYRRSRGTWKGSKVRPESLSPAAGAASPNWGQRGPTVLATPALALPAPPLLPRPSSGRTPPGGPGVPGTPARPAAASPQRSPKSPPLPATAWAARTLDGNSWVAAAGDPRPRPRPQQAPPPSTHRGAPSRVPDADARPTLTAAAAAAAAAAEGWSSPLPSPTARGRPAKPPPPPLQLQPRPRQSRPPRPRPRTARPAAARPLGPSPLARAPGGRGRAPAAGGADHWLSRARRRLSASPRPANCPEPCRTC
ncbi:uncharacterized protein LOC133087132 [Eubalaena glacialis]|uniref:uncharacterized protein LOC133087132 n=1 Tax=Eubalaena glacialis TaxID=27606 RepID=UPI002A5AA923|nr:uncharacterized protein LOC133087132 [Eubalaena glacialis]